MSINSQTTLSQQSYGTLLLRLALGVQARWVALALLPVVLGATWAHSGNGWMFAFANGGWEYPAYLCVLCVAQFLLGDGSFALGPSRPMSALPAGA